MRHSACRLTWGWCFGCPSLRTSACHHYRHVVPQCTPSALFRHYIISTTHAPLHNHDIASFHGSISTSGINSTTRRPLHHPSGPLTRTAATADDGRIAHIPAAPCHHQPPPAIWVPAGPLAVFAAGAVLEVGGREAWEARQFQQAARGGNLWSERAGRWG